MSTKTILCTCHAFAEFSAFAELFWLVGVSAHRMPWWADTMAKLNSRLGYEIKRNELALSNMMKNYDGRQQVARRLEVDVSKVEAASQAPQAMTPGTTRPAKQALNKIEV